MPTLDRETAFAVVMVLLKLLADAVTHTLVHGLYLAESPDPGVTAADQLNEAAAEIR